MSTKKRKLRGSVSTGFGNALVEFDRIFRNLPPAEESVRSGEETRGLSGEGGRLRFELPEDHDGPDGGEPPATRPEGG
jgi:hypothetical protein